MSPRDIACPVCRRSVNWEGNPARPFCSERCRLIDLGAWITEEYRVPGEAALPAAADSHIESDEDR